MQEESVKLSKNEMWKILDSIKSYQVNYALTAPTVKILKNVEKKLNIILNGWKTRNGWMVWWEPTKSDLSEYSNSWEKSVKVLVDSRFF